MQLNKNPKNTKAGRHAAGPLALAATLLACAACDDGSDNPLPVGATVTVSPQTKTFEIDEEIQDENGNCLFNPGFYVDQSIVITVTDGQGSPIGKADLNISLDLGANTFSGLPVMELYDDMNGNGLADRPEERVSDFNDPIFRTKTREFTGERIVILRLNVSCAYRGSLNVISDGFMGVGDYEIVAQSETTPAGG